MKIIIDNNVLFSLMNPHSFASHLLQRKNLEFLAPKFILSEFEEHKEECQQKSSLSKQEFEERKSFIQSKITFIDVQSYKFFLKKAIKLTSDVDDVPYLACAFSQQAPIWSHDLHLKQQSLISIFSTQELLLLLPFD